MLICCISSISLWVHVLSDPTFHLDCSHYFIHDSGNMLCTRVVCFQIQVKDGVSVSQRKINNSQFARYSRDLFWRLPVFWRLTQWIKGLLRHKRGLLKGTKMVLLSFIVFLSGLTEACSSMIQSLILLMESGVFGESDSCCLWSL